MRGFPTSHLSGYTGQDDPFREVNHSRQDVGFLERENLAFGTTAENEGSITPFMARNIETNRRRRNFYIEDGGAIVYFDPTQPTIPGPTPKRVYDHSR